MMDDKKDPKKGNSGEELIRMGALGGAEGLGKLAEKLGMESRLSLDGYTFPEELRRLVPYSFVKKHLALPIAIENHVVIAAIHDPLNLDPIEELRIMLKHEIKAVYSPKDEILSAINLHYHQREGAASALISDMEQAKKSSSSDEDVEIYDLLEMNHSQSPIIKLLNLILTEAIHQGASDIHFEPFEDDLRVRYRIDGVLQDRHAPGKEYQSQLLTRIKVMSKLDIAEHRLPQDGRIKLLLGTREVDLRVSTVPVSGGERIVLRILDKGKLKLGLDMMGMPPKMLALFRRLTLIPEGILLVTGPTGSGKTTTLYSALTEINSSELNIMTIEDPVEYKLKGVAQITVRPKINLTFASGLRHILRQDPDVIMIGEIRDVETAEIAIQASLTGHLVLSTLHTNDAPSAITRLIDMNIEPYLLSSTLVAVLAQRLVRVICPDCKCGFKPTDEELYDVGLKRSDLRNGEFYRGKGCDRCFNTGYAGRRGIYELLVISEKMKKQIVASGDATVFREIATEEGMETMRDHGIHLAIEGITTIAEVLRVTRGIL